MAKPTTQTFNEEDKGDLNERLILKKGYRKIELYALVMNFHFMLHVMMYQVMPPVLSGVRVTRSLVLCRVFCRLLFVLLNFFFWPLCCLFIFDLQILITPLLSSNSS